MFIHKDTLYSTHVNFHLLLTNMWKIKVSINNEGKTKENHKIFYCSFGINISTFQYTNICGVSSLIQGFNARKVISEVYTSFVLQCTVSGR